MADPFSLNGRVAIVTGANRGIGKAITLVLARAGANVALVGRNVPQLEEVARVARSLGTEPMVVKADVSARPEVEAMVAQVVKQYGHIDILVNNAGMTSRGEIEDIEEETWRQVLDVNLTGTYFCCRAVVPIMRRQRYGRIVSISSTAGQRGAIVAAVNYAASKGGIEMLSKTLARQLAPFGITVNTIAPGATESDMIRGLHGGAHEAAVAPVGRICQPEDIGYAALFLASEEAGFITGHTLGISGGSFIT